MSTETIKTIHIALAGCPNAGKTALFNRLTGSHQKVANYAGVTVEYKHGTLQLSDDVLVHLYDVPGSYSLTSMSPDEAIAHKALKQLPETSAPPNLIICVADATNLLLHLRFALELKTLGVPMILALNMADIARKQGMALRPDILSETLGIPVIETVAVRSGGTDALLAEISKVAADTSNARNQQHVIHPPVHSSLQQLHLLAKGMLQDAGMQGGITPSSTYRIDSVLLHPVFGMFALLCIMFGIFQAVFTLAAWPMDRIDDAMGIIAHLVSNHLPDGLIKNFISDALIAGVGSVIIFLPQILILFFFILLLEDSGYMARAAFLLDKIMGGVGLSGRAFIPLLSSFACAIPGIMATRTIPSRRDRLITMLIAPLMTCSARIPVYTLIISAFIPATSIAGLNLQGIVMFGLYCLGLISGLVMAKILARFTLPDAKAHFVMELPNYKLPTWRNLAFGLLERAKIFLRRAGTIIFSVTVILWLLSSFPIAPDGVDNPVTYSAAGILGAFLAPLFAPIGFNWQMVIALIPGLAAREVAIAALATVYAVGNAAGLEEGLTAVLQSAWSLPTALAFLAWYVFAPQCLSTLAVLRREAGSRKWMWFAVIYLTTLAYIFAGITYHTARYLGL